MFEKYNIIYKTLKLFRGASKILTNIYKYYFCAQILLTKSKVLQRLPGGKLTVRWTTITVRQQSMR